MIGAWYAIIAVMLAVYVTLDGFDFGAGIVHLFVAKNDKERRAVLAAIGPVWDGNEVWLIAAGGALFCAFPAAYAAGFSGFYLPLMIVLWLIILRGLSIELRSHLENPLWAELWDAIFSLSSTALALVLGAALGNLLRGVSLDGSGNFAAPLFTNLRTGPNPGILDWYTILVGVFAVALLALHGANWLMMKTEGLVAERSRALAKNIYIIVVILGLLAIISTSELQASLYINLLHRPWSWPLPLIAVASLLMTGFGIYRSSDDRLPFFGTAGFILSTLAASAAALFPVILRSSISPEFDLTANAAAASEHGLRVAFYWWLIGFPLAVGYNLYVYRSMRGKIGSS